MNTTLILVLALMAGSMAVSALAAVARVWVTWKLARQRDDDMMDVLDAVHDLADAARKALDPPPRCCATKSDEHGCMGSGFNCRCSSEEGHPMPHQCEACKACWPCSKS